MSETGKWDVEGLKVFLGKLIGIQNEPNTMTDWGNEQNTKQHTKQHTKY